MINQDRSALSAAVIDQHSAATIIGVTLAILFGSLIILATGFAGADVLHNAAHDMRHGLTFPCH